MIVKKCSKCKQEKLLSNFHKDLRNKTGYNNQCKLCIKDKHKNWRDINPSKMRSWALQKQQKRKTTEYQEYEQDYRLKRNFNISLNEFNRLLESQQGLCKICNKDISQRGRGNIVIDHDHICCPGRTSCGKCIRGILCVSCNFGLAALKDDPIIVQSAIKYLAYHINNPSHKKVTEARRKIDLSRLGNNNE